MVTAVARDVSVCATRRRVFRARLEAQFSLLKHAEAFEELERVKELLGMDQKQIDEMVRELVAGAELWEGGGTWAAT